MQDRDPKCGTAGLPGPGSTTGSPVAPFAEPDWQAFAPPHPLLRAVVIVPAKDEAQLLPRCLAALAAQRTARGAPVDPRSYEVVVLANNCNDDTAAVARRFAAAGRHGTGCAVHVAEATLPREVAHVGQARRLLMDHACERLRAARGRAAAATGGRGVVLSTDGDSFVARDWLDRTLAEIDAGADAVGGRILTEAARSGDRALQRWQRLDAIHRLLCVRLASLIDPEPGDPWPRHHQHFGASLAVAADAYERVGGLPAVRYLEDEALWARLVGADLRVRHSPQVRAYTSCRQDGRVEVGLSWQLRTWASDASAGGAGLHVAPAAEAAALATLRGRLRRLWAERARVPSSGLRGLPGLADALRVPAEWLCDALHEAAGFGALWVEVERRVAAREAGTRVPVEAAIDELRRLIGERLAAASPPSAGDRTTLRGLATEPAC